MLQALVILLHSCFLPCDNGKVSRAPFGVRLRARRARRAGCRLGLGLGQFLPRVGAGDDAGAGVNSMPSAVSSAERRRPANSPSPLAARLPSAAVPGTAPLAVARQPVERRRAGKPPTAGVGCRARRRSRALPPAAAVAAIRLRRWATHRACGLDWPGLRRRIAQAAQRAEDGVDDERLLVPVGASSSGDPGQAVPASASVAICRRRRIRRSGGGAEEGGGAVAVRVDQAVLAAARRGRRARGRRRRGARSAASRRWRASTDLGDLSASDVAQGGVRTRVTQARSASVRLRRPAAGGAVAAPPAGPAVAATVRRRASRRLAGAPRIAWPRPRGSQQHGGNRQQRVGQRRVVVLSKAKPQKASAAPSWRQSRASPGEGVVSAAKRCGRAGDLKVWPMPAGRGRRPGAPGNQKGSGGRQGQPVGRRRAEVEGEAERRRGRRIGSQRAQAGGQCGLARGAGARRRSCPASRARRRRRRVPACRRRCAEAKAGGRCAAGGPGRQARLLQARAVGPVRRRQPPARR